MLAKTKKLCALFGLFSGLLCVEAQPDTDLLSSGQWFRIAITEKGIYKIDKEALRGLGLSPDQVNPLQIELYGQPAGMLPQLLSESFSQRLRPHATYLYGNRDDTWDEGEYVLFYAEDPDRYTYSSTEGRYLYENNLYSDTIYYFMALREAEALQISSLPPPQASPVETLRTYEAYYVYEKEIRNLIRSGRRWYGEILSNITPALSFDVPLRPVPGSTVVVHSEAAASCLSACALDLYIGNQAIGKHVFPVVNEGNYERFAWHDAQSFRYEAQSSSLALEYRLQGASNPGQAYLDYFLIQLSEPLEYRAEGAFFFRHRRAMDGELLRYELVAESASPLFLWEVSDPRQPFQLPFAQEGQQLRFLHQSSRDQPPEFVLFSLAEVRKPHYFAPLSPPPPEGRAELLIVSSPQLFDEAERLANFHRSIDQMQVQLMSTTQLYELVSAGRPDPTAIRNYASHLYQGGGLRYLLLFGAASFDYKGINVPFTHVPTYASRASLNPVTTYASDDYFGFLESSEGNWNEEPAEDHSMDIGVGRIPARSAREASIMVDKIIHYTTDPRTIGSWRQQVYFVADDGDFNLHHKDIEKLSTKLQESHPDFHLHKLYLDDFEQESLGAVQRSSAASKALDQAIEKGALFINFSGHGNNSVWTAEEILSQSQISEWHNPHRLPLFITATCDFGRHDDPIFQSSGEQILFQREGGGIALLGTARPVRSDANFLLNSSLLDAIFEPLSDGTYPRLGDVHRRTKNNSQLGIGNRSFTLLGDPALRLSYPTHQVQITHVNATPIDVFTDTLQARSQVTLRGLITNRTKEPLDYYNGRLEVVVYDKANEVTTLGDENPPFSYPKYNSLIFRGQVSVNKGSFTTSFIIPQSISYRKGTALMFFYSHPSMDAAHALEDAASGLSSLYVGGPILDTEPDFQGPRVEAFLDGKALVNGLSLGLKPTLHLKLSDPQGIKLSLSGLSKNLSISIDKQAPILLSSLYQSDLDSFQSGSLSYELEKLSEGRHAIRIEAWDNYDNLTSYERYFFSSSNTPIELSNVTIFPNPSREKAFISFEHDKGKHRLQVDIQLFDREGRHVFKKTWLYFGEKENFVKFTWNIRNSSLMTGLYVYKLNVRDQEDETKGSAIGKLIVRY